MIYKKFFMQRIIFEGSRQAYNGQVKALIECNVSSKPPEARRRATAHFIKKYGGMTLQPYCCRKLGPKRVQNGDETGQAYAPGVHEVALSRSLHPVSNVTRI
jgi:hypothetical protein